MDHVVQDTTVLKVVQHLLLQLFQEWVTGVELVSIVKRAVLHQANAGQVPTTTSSRKQIVNFVRLGFTARNLVWKSLLMYVRPATTANKAQSTQPNLHALQELTVIWKC